MDSGLSNSRSCPYLCILQIRKYSASRRIALVNLLCPHCPGRNVTCSPSLSLLSKSLRQLSLRLRAVRFDGRTCRGQCISLIASGRSTRSPSLCRGCSSSGRMSLLLSVLISVSLRDWLCLKTLTTTEIQWSTQFPTSLRRLLTVSWTSCSPCIILRQFRRPLRTSTLLLRLTALV